MEKLVAGIDIGGTNTVVGLVNAKGEILSKATVPTEKFPVPEHLVAVVCEEIKKIAEDFSASHELAGIGVGAPNGNFFKGTIEFAPNLKWEGIIPLAEFF